MTTAVESSGKPAVVYPNSGESWDAATRSWAGTATFGPEHAAVWVAAGARLVGGCCRVGPSAIRQLARSAPGWPVGDAGVRVVEVRAQMRPARPPPAPRRSPGRARPDPAGSPATTGVRVIGDSSIAPTSGANQASDSTASQNATRAAAGWA